MSFVIIWPTLALAGLCFAVWATLLVARMRHLKANPPRGDEFASGETALRYFRPVEMPANNLANLFEMPVLYFALVPLLLVTGTATAAQVLLAWAFVLTRALHSYIHIGPKKVQQRFLVYAISCAFLLAMWIGFGIDLLAVAREAEAALTTTA